MNQHRIGNRHASLDLRAFLGANGMKFYSVAAVLITRFRNDLTDAETQLHLHAWQLRQLVPAEAHRTPPPPRP